MSKIIRAAFLIVVCTAGGLALDLIYIGIGLSLLSVVFLLVAPDAASRNVEASQLAGESEDADEVRRQG